ncbi:hypothetical protein [Leucobacter ruminantium]|uniref:Uncharacterized protein n=1 Tax=Leucobacter ruminantium TaxID=1289170 RepID=A0A939LWQ6_9MICO|nr:hypothetical protein [Leucobacter ruminantium]MBO1803792.1 hypothetical protein [Leucobacter ruminantium]
MTNPVETEIRALVRELLREVMPADPGARSEERRVRIASDADLAAFANRILDIARDPAEADAVRSGRVRFVLEGAPSSREGDPSPEPRPAAPVLRIEKGAVTEKTIAQAVANGTRLVLGPRAVVTPLAREAARKHGVGIERAS